MKSRVFLLVNVCPSVRENDCACACVSLARARFSLCFSVCVSLSHPPFLPPPRAACLLPAKTDRFPPGPIPTPTEMLDTAETGSAAVPPPMPLPPPPPPPPPPPVAPLVEAAISEMAPALHPSDCDAIADLDAWCAPPHTPCDVHYLQSPPYTHTHTTCAPKH